MPQKPSAKVGKIEQVVDGKSHRYYIRDGGSAVFYTICCDCSLVHLEKLTPRKGYIAAEVWREDELTAQFRKKEGYGKRKRK